MLTQRCLAVAFGGALAFLGAGARASCPLDDATKAYVLCESDIDWHDAHAALRDCRAAGIRFRACRADSIAYSRLDVKHRDELEFYIAYSQFGVAGAELHSAATEDEVARARRDFFAARVGFEQVIANGNLPPKMMTQAKLMVRAIQANGDQ
jgi:hypothetical protein